LHILSTLLTIVLQITQLVTIRNHNVILDAKFTSQLHPKVLYELGKICPEKQLKFKSLYQSKQHNLHLAYGCLLLFPGTHYALMGKWQLQVIFWLTGGGALIWWLTDLLRLPKLVKESNVINQNKMLRETLAVSIFIKNESNESDASKSTHVA
jgi:hypothetical protein